MSFKATDDQGSLGIILSGELMAEPVNSLGFLYRSLMQMDNWSLTGKGF